MDPSHPQATVELNRRVAPRKAPKGKVECRKGTIGLGPNLAESWLDISETGARLVVKSGLRVGQEVELKLLGKGHLRPVTMLAEVVWITPRENDRHCVGLRFRHRISYADFQNLT